MASTSGYSFNQTFDDDDADEDRKHFVAGRDATIAVIDCSQSMFELDDGVCLFTNCLAALEKLLLRRIVTDKTDMFGILLYNTQHSPEPNSHEEFDIAVPANRCAVLMPVQQIDTDLIRYIKNLRSSDDFMDFDNKFGHTDDAKISDLLWLSTTMFTNARKQIKSRTIIWFTDQDNPLSAGKMQLQQAFQKAKDIQQLQIEVIFCPLQKNFDGDKFYKEFICQIMAIDIDELDFPEPLLDETLLANRINRRGYNKRSMAYLEFEISSALKFGVGIYSNKRSDKATLKSTQLSRINNEVIKKTRTTKFAYKTHSDDANDEEEQELDFTETLYASKTVKYHEVGGEEVRFTPLEAFETKQVMNPKLKLLAFKPKSFVDECNHHIKPSTFVYPHDGRIKNSSKLFTALWQRMIDEEKVAICAFTMRLRSHTRLVVLVPSQQALQDDELISYDGFRLIFMPFADDIRDLSAFMPEPVEPWGNDFAVKDQMKKIMSKLKTKYTPTMFENLHNFRIQTLVECQVYEEDLDEKILEAFHVPNIEKQDERIQSYVDTIEELIGGFQEVTVTKRKKETDENGNSEKRAKKSSAEDLNKDYILQKCMSNDVKSVTVQQLKDYLASEKVTGISKLKKEALVAKIVELKK